MSTDLLMTISDALKIDLFSFYYSEYPLKSFRNDEVAQLNTRIQNNTEQIQKLPEGYRLLQKELALTRELNEAQKEIISLIKEQLADHKTKLANQPLLKETNQSLNHEVPVCPHRGF